ncbi:hypothetical protein PVAND_003417 [Polypedilum vanderplanki]|uniref:BPTI/Kunitz inhibitor domain-containing protein n=1 Tax=Polypedilum vanderplanki TaxID=319348 RepID=A0A9J6BUG8_POLVA|nr:hypothetical protein PVAND_003417 [Polypedilum vanderplanki]
MKPLSLLIPVILFVFCVCDFEVKLNCTEQHDDKFPAELYREKICQMPRIIGSCKLKQKRYFYNRTANECLVFYYQGCGGNRNNFKTKLYCDCACVQHAIESNRSDF